MNLYKISKKKTRVIQNFIHELPKGSKPMTVQVDDVTYRYIVDFKGMIPGVAYYKLTHIADDIPIVYLNGLRMKVSTTDTSLDSVDCMFIENSNSFYFTDTIQEGDEIIVEYITRGSL